MQIKPVTRRGSKLRALIYGPTFSGKTATCLRMGKVFTGDMGKVVLIDTEAGRGKHFLNTEIGGVSIEQYLYGEIEPPFNLRKFIEALDAAEKMPGVEFIIIDGLSALWAGPGGLLEKKLELDRDNPMKLSTWDAIGKDLNEFIRVRLMRSPKHIICTARGKNEWVQVPKDDGKMGFSLVGVGPEIRKNVPFEFDFVFDIQPVTHEVMAVKDATMILPLDRSFLLDEKVIATIRDWLDLGTGVPENQQIVESVGGAVRRCPDCNAAMALQREDEVVGQIVLVYYCKGCRAVKRVKKA